MSDPNILYSSVGQAIDDAITKFKNKASIKECLQWMNCDIDRLTSWAYDTDTFFNDDYVFLTSENELFVTDDDLLEYFDADQLDLKADLDILDFLNDRANDLFEDPTAAHFHYRDDIVITTDCEMWGQGGPHFSNFNIYSSKEAYFKYLVDKGHILWHSKFLSHSNEKLVSMFEKNVTNKYFDS